MPKQRVSKQKPRQPPEKLHVMVSFGLEEVPPEFDLQNRVLWQYKGELDAIRVRTGAQISLGGGCSERLEPQAGREAPESLFIRIEHPSLPALQSARQMAEVLIESVRQEFEKFQEEQRGNNGGARRFSSPNISGSSSTSHHFPPLRQLTVGEEVSPNHSKSPASGSKSKRDGINEDACKKSKTNEEQETNLSRSKEELNLKQTQGIQIFPHLMDPLQLSGNSSNTLFPLKSSVSAQPGSSAAISSHFSPYRSPAQNMPVFDRQQSTSSSLPSMKSEAQAFAELFQRLKEARQSFTQGVHRLEDPLSTRVQAEQTSSNMVFKQEPSRIQTVELDHLVHLSSVPIEHITVNSNHGMIKITLSPKGNNTLYASVAHQLFGPLRSLRELELSAIALRRRAVNYVRKNKAVFFHQVKDFYRQVEPKHTLNDEIAFECGCVVLCDSSQTPFQGHGILLLAIATLFSNPISIYKEDSMSVDGMKLAQKQTVFFPIHTVTKVPLSVVKRRSGESHYDSVLFHKPQRPITGTNEIFLPDVNVR